MSRPHLPERLHAAYNWTDAAGELDTLKRLRGCALAAYCIDSAANSTENGDGDVTEGDLELLHHWLNGERIP